MLHFESDYMEGACPEILERLQAVNLEKNPGYGHDRFCMAAAERIRLACACPEAEVHFLVGGTQTNAAIIGALLRPYEGVFTAETGHIYVHEGGAIEHTGHKVLALPGVEGKLPAGAVEAYMERFLADDTRAHMVQPALVYISQPTEYGTVYSRGELTELRRVCDRFGLELYIDGARLGYALAAHGADVGLHDVARLADAFYIGGTKQGALFGEAVVLPRPGRIAHFETVIKQSGALLAKGWLLGLQFQELFTDGLYQRLARHAVDMAMLLRQGLLEKGVALLLESPTNQQFPIFDAGQLEKLDGRVGYSVWEKCPDGRTAVRLVTSWATQRAEVEALLHLL